MELARSTSRGGFSVRGIFTFVLTVFVAALLWVFFASPVAQAAEEEAVWTGTDSITYDGYQYFGPTVAKASESHGLTEGTQLYTYIEEVGTGSSMTKKAHVIYFAPGADPPVETTANYVVYDFSGQTFSNPQSKKSIVITPQGESALHVSSCSVGGVGWIICPVSVFLSEAMDWIFDVIAGMMKVQPLTLGDTHDDLYMSWDIMRGIANVAFIIVFLIIIYAQLTSAGISNYGLKKLIPRLIIAAVAVNLSFYICAIAVDLSNILGYSIQDAIQSVRDENFNINEDTWGNQSTLNWQGLTTAVLSGSAIAVGVYMASPMGAVYILLPVLIGMVVSALVALVILAVRQAVIVILIVLAPLAFVAYLLPNTEKWFNKWREVFMTMLVFFPAFSVVFSLSQVAGGIIIENAESIIMLILGMAVQVAPLAITPLLIRLSGDVVGKIATMINSPTKGLMSRVRAWSGETAEMHKQEWIAKPTNSKLNPRRLVQRSADNSQKTKDRTELAKLRSTNRYKGNPKYSDLYEKTHHAEHDKKLIDARLERDLNQKIRMTPGMLKEEMNLRLTTDEVSASTEQLNRVHEGLHSGQDLSPTRSLGSDFTRRAQRVSTEMAATAISVQNSKRVQQAQLSRNLLENTFKIDSINIRDWAGMSDPDNGDASALTYAVNLKREAEAKLVDERKQLIKHFKFNGGQRQQLATGNNVTAIDDDGIQYTFLAADTYARDAAIEEQLRTGSWDEIAEIISSSGSNGFEYRSTISDAIPANGIPNKGIFLGGRFIDEVGRGRVDGMTGMNPANGTKSLEYWAAQTILEGKIKAETLANNEGGAILLLFDAAQNAIANGYIEAGKENTFLRNKAALKDTARLILDPSTDLDRNSTEDAKKALAKIRDQL